MPNGFFLYLGNKRKPDSCNRGKNVDFMALEIENGYPISIIDLGDRPQWIIGNNNIANEQWHQLIVERTGSDVEFTVREKLKDGRENLQSLAAIPNTRYSKGKSKKSSMADGPYECDRLIASDIPSTGYRFSGHGYVMLDAKSYPFKQRSSPVVTVTRDHNWRFIFVPTLLFFK